MIDMSSMSVGLREPGLQSHGFAHCDRGPKLLIAAIKLCSSEA